MKLPMAAQIAGAVTNIILDPLLIFGRRLSVQGKTNLPDGVPLYLYVTARYPLHYCIEHYS